MKDWKFLTGLAVQPTLSQKEIENVEKELSKERVEVRDNTENKGKEGDIVTEKEKQSLISLLKPPKLSNMFSTTNLRKKECDQSGEDGQIDIKERDTGPVKDNSSNWRTRKSRKAVRLTKSKRVKVKGEKEFEVETCETEGFKEGGSEQDNELYKGSEGKCLL